MCSATRGNGLRGRHRLPEGRPSGLLDRRGQGDGTQPRVPVAFQAADTDAVHAFYDTALKLGAESLHAPRLWPSITGYFGAFVRDPDGNNVEASFTAPRRAARLSRLAATPSRGRARRVRRSVTTRSARVPSSTSRHMCEPAALPAAPSRWGIDCSSVSRQPWSVGTAASAPRCRPSGARALGRVTARTSPVTGSSSGFSRTCRGPTHRRRGPGRR